MRCKKFASRGSSSVPGIFFLTIPHPCLFFSLPPLSPNNLPPRRQGMSPLLIWSPSIGDPRERRGYVAIPPTCACFCPHLTKQSGKTIGCSCSHKQSGVPSRSV